MKLYSIQPLLVYEHLLTGASWTANPFAGEEPADDVFLRAYDWLAGQMRSYGRHPEDRATQYPVWAWYWWAGLTRPKPDLRTASLRNWGNGGPNVLLTLDIPEDRVVLTDFGISRNIDDISGLTTTKMTVGAVARPPPSVR